MSTTRQRTTNWLPAGACPRALLAGAGTLALMLSASGCSLFHSAPEAVGADAAAPAGKRTGLALEADQLLDTDRRFASRSLEIGAPDAFREYWDEQGLRLMPAGEPVIGPDQVRGSLAAGLPMILSWEPRYAEVFAPGDWGWSWGDWQAHEPGAGGRRLAQGRYITLWKKQPDGSWKVRMDTGNTSPN